MTWRRRLMRFWSVAALSIGIMAIARTEAWYGFVCGACVVVIALNELYEPRRK